MRPCPEDRQPLSIPRQGLMCRLEGGQNIPGHSYGLGNSCACPGQRLIEAPGLGGQAAVCLCSLGLGERGWRTLDLAHSQALHAWLATFWFATLWAPLSSPVSFLKVQSVPHLGPQNQLGKQSFSLLFGSPGLVLGPHPNCLCSDCLQSLWAWPGPSGICDLPVDSSFGTTDLQRVLHTPVLHLPTEGCHPALISAREGWGCHSSLFGARPVWTLGPCLELI